MNVTVLGATGGLGRNVVDAALSHGHAVKALVRDSKRAKLPALVWHQERPELKLQG